MEWTVLALVVIWAIAVLVLFEESVPILLVNGVIGVMLLLLTNLVLSPPLPINPLTIAICGMGGVVGWLVILILRILEIAFTVAV
jgi:hypothetical protein